MTVKGGYSPDLIVVKQGRPVKLDFYRDETASQSSSCASGGHGGASTTTGMGCADSAAAMVSRSSRMSSRSLPKTLM